MEIIKVSVTDKQELKHLESAAKALGTKPILVEEVSATLTMYEFRVKSAQEAFSIGRIWTILEMGKK